jgi:hypothetical protein
MTREERAEYVAGFGEALQPYLDGWVDSEDSERVAYVLIGALPPAIQEAIAKRIDQLRVKK